MNQSDEELLMLVQAGNQDAFAALVRRYQWVAIRYALKHTFDRNIAEDLAQEAFARLYTHCRQIELRGQGSVKAWFFRVIRNLCIDQNRKSSCFTWVPYEDTLLADSVYSQTSAEQFEHCDALVALAAGLRELSPHQREALYLATVEQLPIAEVAKVMHTSVANIKVLIHRGRRKLVQSEHVRPYLEQEAFKSCALI